MTFGGTNAILRREALMHLDVDADVRAVEHDVKRTLAAADTIIRRPKKTAGQGDWVMRTALDKAVWPSTMPGGPSIVGCYWATSATEFVSRWTQRHARWSTWNAIAAIGGGAPSGHQSAKGVR